MARSKSFLRREEHRVLSNLSIDGAVLDVGGAKRSAYLGLLKGNHTVTVGNIDPEYGLDIEFDAEERWPVEDASYQAVLLVNILEHLYRHQHALKEAYRVLAEGGRVIGVVPFMLNIHSAPRDFFRYSRYTLQRSLFEAGFVSIRVEALGTGYFSVLYQTSLALVPGFLATPLIALARALDGLLDRLKPGSALSREMLPLGYYFEANKP